MGFDEKALLSITLPDIASKFRAWRLKIQGVAFRAAVFRRHKSERDFSNPNRVKKKELL